MRRFLLAAVALLSATALRAEWAKDGLWNDGRAEVAVYDSERVVDGKVRKFREHLITMKETDGPKKTRGFRFHQAQTIELENYSRHYLTEISADGDTARKTLKIVDAVQDWNGNSVLTYKEGDAGVEKDDYFDAQIPLAFRSLPFKDGVEKSARIWEITAASGPVVTKALISISAGETVRGRNSLPCWLVTVTKGDRADKYWFEKKSPNILVKMETADGRKRLLYGRARWTFWDRRIPRPNILK